MAHVHANTPFAPLGIAVLTVSDTRGFDEDGSGDLLAERLTEAGHALVERRIVPDDVYRIRAVVSKWVVRDDILVAQLDARTRPCNFVAMVLPDAKPCVSRQGPEPEAARRTVES